MAQVPKDKLEEHKSIFHSIDREQEPRPIDSIPVKEFKEKTVCIVKFNNPELPNQVAGRFYQVTIDPGKLSPSKNFIRLGSHPGDELLGWQPTEWLSIEEILGTWDGDNLPVLQYGRNDGVTMQISWDEGVK